MFEPQLLYGRLGTLNHRRNTLNSKHLLLVASALRRLLNITAHCAEKTVKKSKCAKIYLRKCYAALIRTMTISGWIHSELKFGDECISAKQRAGAQQFRCNYDMKNSKASCHINPFV